MSKFFSPRYLIAKYWKDSVFMLLFIVALTTWMQKDMLEQDTLARNFVLPTLTGQPKDLLQPSQKTLIYFFAPWCSVCKLSMGNLSSLNKNINTVAVALDYQNRAEVEDFITDIQVDTPILLGNNQIATTYKVSAFPSYYVVDEKGNILDRSMGYSSLAGLLWRTR